MGYEFYWEPFSDSPFYCHPDGRRIYLETEEGCAYLMDKDPIMEYQSCTAAPGETVTRSTSSEPATIPEESEIGPPHGPNSSDLLTRDSAEAVLLEDEATLAALRKHVHSIEHMMAHEPTNPMCDVCN